MCLLLLALDTHPSFKLVLAANRDEYYDRPTAPPCFWEHAPHLLAGRDLAGGGTWLGITRHGRIAAITNYRQPASFKKEAPSRGKLVTDFLLGKDSPSITLRPSGPMRVATTVSTSSLEKKTASPGPRIGATGLSFFHQGFTASATAFSTPPGPKSFAAKSFWPGCSRINPFRPQIPLQSAPGSSSASR